ncbi:MAG: glycosyltransferase family A protein [Marinirhabdus sp.]|nr:glycosyltransferase family A protein [Marinirhabdus sp.]
MFTIVMPVYNKVDYLEKSVNSVLTQTFSDFELIVINDGSTDLSHETLNAYDDPRMQIITTSNKGAATARNIGISKAEYPYIAFLDADDWWDERYLEEIKWLIVKYPNATIYATGRTHVFKSSTVRYNHRLLPVENSVGLLDYFQIISKYLPAINMSNTVVRKNNFQDTLRFVDGMRNYEDHELWLRIATQDSIVYVNKPLSFYRKDIAESQSKQRVLSNDLLKYLETCDSVFRLITQKEKRWFQKYLNKFLLRSYAKYRNTFSSTDRKQLESFCDTLLTGPNQWVYKALKFIT